MSRDPLRALARLRLLAVDTARRELAEALRAEGAAEGGVEAAQEALRSEAAAASGPDGLAAAFAAWLPRGRQAVGEARGRLDAVQALVAAAQADVVAARAAAKAVEAVRSGHAEEQAQARLRREQAAIDEHAGRRRPERR